MTTARRLAGFAFVSVLAGAGACVDRLPDQDLRILEASPAARLSADILWREYDADASAADRAYWGEAIIVTGEVTAVHLPVSALTDGAPPDVAVQPWFVVDFGQTATGGVRARLLDEQAQAITAGLEVGRRLTLKCFCEGRPDGAGGDILLKSCIRS